MVGAERMAATERVWLLETPAVRAWLGAALAVGLPISGVVVWRLSARPDLLPGLLALTVTECLLVSVGVWVRRQRRKIRGRPAKVLTDIAEAVTKNRQLAVTNPDRHRPEVADSLHNLGSLLSALGRPAEALPVTLEAGAIYRELAGANPGRYRPYLAHSLTNLGTRFAELGRPAEALPALREAVEMYRELAAANPDRFRPALARALLNLTYVRKRLGETP